LWIGHSHRFVSTGERWDKYGTARWRNGVNNLLILRFKLVIV
jgi:hypothetical protein